MAAPMYANVAISEAREVRLHYEKTAITAKNKLFTTKIHNAQPEKNPVTPFYATVNKSPQKTTQYKSETDERKKGRLDNSRAGNETQR